MSEPTIFGVRLKEQRMARGLTQEELAQKANLTGGKNHISHFEVGVTPYPNVKTLVALADALGCKVDALVR